MRRTTWLSVLLGVGLFFCAPTTTVVSATPPTLDSTVNGAKLYTYETNCSGSLQKTQAFIIPEGISSVDSIYLYFHGSDNPSAQTICSSSGGNFCKYSADLLKSNINAAIVLSLENKSGTESTDPILSTSERTCYLNEVKEKISSVTSLSSSPSYTLLAHSIGSHTLLEFLKQNPIGTAAKTIIFDGCWNDRCDSIAKASNSGPVTIYASNYDGNLGQAAAAQKNNQGKVSLQTLPQFKTFNEHKTIPKLCFLTHITNDNCQGKAITANNDITAATEYGIGASCEATILNTDCKHSLDCEDSSLNDNKDNFCVCSTAQQCSDAYGSTPGETWECKDGTGIDAAHALHYCQSNKNRVKYPVVTETDKSWTDSSTLVGDLTHGFTGTALSEEELRALLRKPFPKITIPGLNFSDLTVVGNLNKDEVGDSYLDVPFLGEYLAAIYRYLIVISGIVCVVRIITGGLLYAIPDTSGNSKSAGKTMIEHAITGLIITASSYIILYTINPNLVEFKNLRVLYIRGEPIETDFEEWDETAFGGNESYTGAAATEQAKNIASLLTQAETDELKKQPSCSPQAANYLAQVIMAKQVCAMPCSCAWTATRFLSLIGCDNPIGQMAAPASVDFMKTGNWGFKEIDSSNTKNLPVGMLWTPGHVGVSLGNDKFFDSSNGVPFPFGGSCPKTIGEVLANPGICNYCAHIIPRDPAKWDLSKQPANCTSVHGWAIRKWSPSKQFQLVIYPLKAGESKPVQGCCTIKNKNNLPQQFCKWMALNSVSDKGNKPGIKEITETKSGTVTTFFYKSKKTGTWDSNSCQ